MGILSNLFGKQDSRVELVSRRTFLRNVIQAAPVAVAVGHAGIPRGVRRVSEEARRPPRSIVYEGH